MKAKKNGNSRHRKVSTARPAGFWAAAALMQGQTQWFVSLMGRLWTPVTVDPRLYSRQDVEVTLAPDAAGFRSLEYGIRYFVVRRLPLRIFPPIERPVEAIRDL